MTTSRATWQAALGLALAAAVSLGMARFSYALLLPAMRAELGWSYFTAGAMNTANAAGYLAGALLMPRLVSRFDARAVLLAGGAGTALLMALHGAQLGDASLYALRTATGIASAGSFVTGGLLAARLAAGQAALGPGLVLGLYYGGTGLGIIVSTLVVPPLDWRSAWVALGGLCALATALTAWSTRELVAPPTPGAPRQKVGAVPFAFGLAGYLMFGLGYIGYMTFVITPKPSSA
jgi:predicted MFS family arabinose efflux permease